MSDSALNRDKIIQALADKALIDSAQALKLKNEDVQYTAKLPIMNEILIGFGACLSTLFFCMFVGATSFMGVASKYLFLFWSIAFIGLALAMHYLQKKQEKNNVSAYWRDTSVCFMIAGKVLFLGACYEFFHLKFNGINLVLIASIFITALIYPIYQNVVDRFISISGIFTLMWAKIYYFPEMHAYSPVIPQGILLKKQLIINIFLLFHFILLAYLNYSKKMMFYLEPIRYSVLFSILVFFICIFSTWHILPSPPHFIFFDYFVSALVVLAACGVILDLTNFKYEWLQQPVTNILLLVVFLGLFVSPEIIFSLTLILYGYGHRENKIGVVGLLFFPFFLFNYYYYMPVTLLYKSLYLMLAGGLFILFSFYLQYHDAKGKQYAAK